MKDYTVKWEIPMGAENSKQAAVNAIKELLENNVRVFEVTDELTGKIQIIDLSI